MPGQGQSHLQTHQAESMETWSLKVLGPWSTVQSLGSEVPRTDLTCTVEFTRHLLSTYYVTGSEDTNRNRIHSWL